ncbi:hypothetical protein Tco_0665330, partial [Tanacetum coccineum]
MTSCSQAVNKSPTHYPCDSARTFRVILFSIHNDEWKSFQCHHQTALRRPYALSWKPCQGDSLNLPDHRIHKDGDGDASFQLKSDSLPHAHAQTTKTFYKHQDSRIMKAQELKTKTSAQTLIYKIFLQRYQVYQGRLLASFQDDAKYEHVGQDTRSQGGKDDQDKQGKDLKISDIKTKSKDNDKGSRSKITKHEGTSLQRIQRPRPQDLNDKSNLIDLMKECHNELTSGEIVSLKILSRTRKLFMDNEQHRHNGYTANQLNVNKQQGTKAKRNLAVGDSDHINGASNLNISNRVPFGRLENTITNESPQYGRVLNSNETVVTTCLSPFEECTVASNKENIVTSGRYSWKGRNKRHYLNNRQTYKSLNDEGCSTAMNVEVNMDASTSLVSDKTLVTDKDYSESIQAEYGVLPSYDNDIDIP